MASTLITSAVASATHVFTNSTPSHSNRHNPSYIPPSSADSARVFAILGLSLLMVAICSLSAAVIKFSRSDRRTAANNADRTGVEIIHVLDQAIINKSFPIRVFPSMQQVFLDNDDIMCETTTVTVEKPHDTGSTTTTTATTTTTTMIAHNEKTNRSHNRSDYADEDAKQVLPQLSRRHSFVGLSQLGRLWSRDSSTCQSPSPSLQLPRVLSFNAALMQPISVLSTDHYAFPTQKIKCESSQMEVEVEAVSNDMCSICLCEYEAEDRIRLLPCAHEYHAECIDEWLCTKSTQCPLCKRELLNDISMTFPNQP